MQADGNLVLYAPGSVPIWASNTAGNDGAQLDMQTDGNLVVAGPGGTPLYPGPVRHPVPGLGLLAGAQVLRPLLAVVLGAD